MYVAPPPAPPFFDFSFYSPPSFYSPSPPIYLPTPVDPAPVVVLREEPDHAFANGLRTAAVVTVVASSPLWFPVVLDAFKEGGAFYSEPKLKLTLLHKAAALTDDAEEIRALVQLGAFLEAKDSEGLAPLHLAAMFGNTKATEALLAAGASLDTQTEDGFTTRFTPLHLAASQAKKGGRSEVIVLLVTAGASLEAQTQDGSTPLHMAVEHVETIEVLVAAGVSLEAQDKKGQTPLYVAAALGHAEGIMALKAAGASLEAQDKGGWTPLHKAVSEDHTEAIRALLAAGARVDAQGSFSNVYITPLDVAMAEGHSEAAKALVAAGASVGHRG